MAALTLPTLACLVAALGIGEYWKWTRDTETIADARRSHALQWVLAATSVGVLYAAGTEFGPLVPEFAQFVVAYLLIVPALTVPKAIVKRYDLRPDGAFNPILCARSRADRALFTSIFVPTAVVVFALPAVAFPDAPLLAGALSVVAVAVQHRFGSYRYVAVRSVRTVLVVAAFWFVLLSPGAGVATAVVAVAAAKVLYVGMALSGLKMRPSNDEPTRPAT